MSDQQDFVDSVWLVEKGDPQAANREEDWSEDPNCSEEHCGLTPWRSTKRFSRIDESHEVEKCDHLRLQQHGRDIWGDIYHETKSVESLDLVPPYSLIQNTPKRKKRRFTKRRETKAKPKNVLTNLATGLRRFIKSRVNAEQMLRYEQLFGQRADNKAMESWTSLFRSQFYGLCKEYFDFHVLRSLIRSNVSRKALMIKYLPVMRQALLKRELTRLEPCPDDRSR